MYDVPSTEAARPTEGGGHHGQESKSRDPEERQEAEEEGHQGAAERSTPQVIPEGAEMDKREALDAGYRVYCRNCLELYRTVPVALFQGFPGQRPVPCCDKCGSDQFARIEDDQEPNTL